MKRGHKGSENEVSRKNFQETETGQLQELALNIFCPLLFRNIFMISLSLGQMPPSSHKLSAGQLMLNAQGKDLFCPIRLL